MRDYLPTVSAILRRIVGAPDYERYVQHMLVHHSEIPPVGREEFMRERLAARYSRPGARCC